MSLPILNQIVVGDFAKIGLDIFEQKTVHVPTYGSFSFVGGQKTAPHTTFFGFVF